MSDAVDRDDETDGVTLEYELDAPPETVWRAVSIAEYRERWLPAELLAADEPLAAVPGEAVSYGMRDDEPPYLASVVTFELSPGEDGGTRLRIIHRLADARLDARVPAAANGNGSVLMRAA